MNVPEDQAPRKASRTKRQLAMSSTSRRRKAMTSRSAPAAPSSPPRLPTGRVIVLVRPGAHDGAVAAFRRLGLQVADSRDTDGIAPEEGARGADVLVLPAIGAAIAALDSDRLARLISDVTADPNHPVLAVLPENVTLGGTHPLTDVAEIRARLAAGLSPADDMDPAFAADALILPPWRWPADLTPGVDELRSFRLVNAEVTRPQSTRSLLLDEVAPSWALLATGALETKWTGSGVRVAVLDTGLALGHPDFVGRPPVARQNFVPGVATVEDRNGHGTHCAGLVAGPLHPSGGAPRYGVAPAADLCIGKVMTDTGSTVDGWVAQGIQWAVQQRCSILSISVQQAVARGQPHSPMYEHYARAALAAGTLIVAAAGNHSRRSQGHFAPVAAPANSPSVLAVGALAVDGHLYEGSARELNPNGGEINIVAPGVHVGSSYAGPQPYTALSGTSQAAPIVTGLAALYRQAAPDLDAVGLWRLLLQRARKLGSPVTDVGAGFAMAPP
jgi:subtilisin